MDSFHENIKHTKETISTLNHSLEENLSKLDSHRINLKESIYDLKNQISASYKGPRRLKSYCLTGMILATMFCLVCVLDGFGTFLSMEIDDVTMEIKNVTSEIKHFQDQILDKSENTTNIPSSLFPSSYSSTSTISTTMVDLTTLSPVTSPFPSVSTTYRYTTLGTTTSYTPSPQCNCRLIMFLAHYALRLFVRIIISFHNQKNIFLSHIDCQNITLGGCNYTGASNLLIERFFVDEQSIARSIDRCRYFCDKIYGKQCNDFVYDNIAKSCSLYDVRSSEVEYNQLDGCEEISGDAGENIPNVFECFPFFSNTPHSCAVSCKIL